MFIPVIPLSVSFTIEFNGKPIPARQGETVAACLLRAGVPSFRSTPVNAMPRLPFCIIGHCFDCLVEIEGQGSRQACLSFVQVGMQVWPQDGAVAIPGLA